MLVLWHINERGYWHCYKDVTPSQFFLLLLNHWKMNEKGWPQENYQSSCHHAGKSIDQKHHHHWKHFGNKNSILLWLKLKKKKSTGLGIRKWIWDPNLSLTYGTLWISAACPFPESLGFISKTELHHLHQWVTWAKNSMRLSFLHLGKWDNNNTQTMKL